MIASADWCDSIGMNQNWENVCVLFTCRCDWAYCYVPRVLCFPRCTYVLSQCLMFPLQYFLCDLPGAFASRVLCFPRFNIPQGPKFPTFTWHIMVHNKGFMFRGSYLPQLHTCSPELLRYQGPMFSWFCAARVLCSPGLVFGLGSNETNRNRGFVWVSRILNWRTQDPGRAEAREPRNVGSSKSIKIQNMQYVTYTVYMMLQCSN